MSRGRIRPLAVLLAVMLASTLVAACGGGSSDSTSSSTSSAEEAGHGSSASPGGIDTGGAKKSSQPSSPAGGSGSGSKEENVATPLQVSGGGSQQFVVKGGDNSVQEFGEESDEAELQEAAEALHNFLVARAEGRWADACSRLSAKVVEQLEQLAKKSERKGCASFLSAFTTQLSAAVWREITTVDAGSLRHEGDQGFLLYYGDPEKTVYSMPLNEEDGEWKVAALAGSALTPPK